MENENSTNLIKKAIHTIELGQVNLESRFQRIEARMNLIEIEMTSLLSILKRILQEKQIKK